jgi:hypothetical protein
LPHLRKFARIKPGLEGQITQQLPLQGALWKTGPKRTRHGEKSGAAFCRGHVTAFLRDADELPRQRHSLLHTLLELSS